VPPETRPKPKAITATTATTAAGIDRRGLRGLNHPHPQTPPHPLHLSATPSIFSSPPLKSCLHKIFLDTHFCVRAKSKRRSRQKKKLPNTQTGQKGGGGGVFLGGGPWVAPLGCVAMWA